MKTTIPTPCSIDPEDFATPEQIDRSIARLHKIGDVSGTAPLSFITEMDAQRQAELEQRRAQLEAAREAEALRRAAGQDLPLFA